jgi:flavodoxin
MPKTGSAKKVAEAIYGAIPQSKEIKRIESGTSFEGYDLSFLGFPTYASGPNREAKAFLEAHTEGRAMALFITHMAPEDAPSLQGWIQKFKDAAVGANIVGIFDCQAEASRLVKIFVRIHANPQARASVRASSRSTRCSKIGAGKSLRKRNNE